MAEAQTVSSIGHSVDWVALTHEIGESIAARSARSDQEDEFVAASIEELRARRFYSSQVPRELGGGGAVIDQFGAATAALLVCMAMTLVRSIAGPTVFDRILAVNSFGTKTVLLIAVYGFLSGRPDFLDLALVYALMNFIGTIAVMKFVRFGDLGGMDEAQEESP